jgi:4-alpha-glucanotransferase
MRFSRSSGILLHPTALPGPWGIGDLGEEAYRFVDFLAAAGQRLWQILPLGPTSFGDSPYQCFSAFAGNPLLVSLDRLVADELLDRAELEQAFQAKGHTLHHDYVDYGPVIEFKLPLLRSSYQRLLAGVNPNHSAGFTAFCIAQKAWLDDYGLFMALKDAHGGVSWDNWQPALAAREPAALAEQAAQLAEQIQVQKYLQYLFFHQWGSLKNYANAHDIAIIGDAPIFVAYDSADVWANRELFYLDEQGKPTVIAGVPPDYFSATGQRWGNPLYRWPVMAATGYAWWIARLRQTLSQVDILRLDHFRGFAAYWEIPSSEETAINGRWVRAPGGELFGILEQALGDLPIIAEDLGVITPDVEALRQRFHLPGMKVLQFAFDGNPHHNYLPHNYEPNYVVYTGTHDNDTTVGWFWSLSEAQREIVRSYMGHNANDIGWDMLRLALMSVADIAVAPLQDILRLGSEARTNVPGQAGGNWAWRFHAHDLNEGLAHGLRFLTHLYGRAARPPASQEPSGDDTYAPAEE